ncbi:MAG: hypothetical protein ACRC2O_12750 [Chitinophagaceae bacterium]
MDNFQNTGSVPAGPVRPTLLTVLCILTFIASAWGIFSGISNYMNADISSQIAGTALDTAKENISKENENTAASKMAEKVISGASAMLNPENIKKNALFSILANLLSFGGAFLMFQLKKIGFWTYVAGAGIAIITPLIVYGPSNLMGIGITAIYGFFGILFAVLYSLNLKYMH